MKNVLELIKQQRNNEKLWIEPILENERDLQNELRRLHEALGLEDFLTSLDDPINTINAVNMQIMGEEPNL